MVVDSNQKDKIEKDDIPISKISIFGSYLNFHRKKQGISLENICSILGKNYSIVISKGK